MCQRMIENWSKSGFKSQSGLQKNCSYMYCDVAYCAAEETHFDPALGLSTDLDVEPNIVGDRLSVLREGET